MTGVMAKEKQEPASQAAERKRVVRSYRLEPELLDAIAEFIDDQDVPPSEIAVIERAAKEFLEKRGFWPKKKRNGH